MKINISFCNCECDKRKLTSVSFSDYAEVFNSLFCYPRLDAGVFDAINALVFL
jgi:hypothetical protein